MGHTYDLQHERVKHLDLTQYSLVESGTPVSETVDKMRAEHRNCALITKNGKLVGIFTDRDVLHKVVVSPDAWNKPVDEVMTANPFTVTEDDQAETALVEMNTRRFRNVPVVDKDGHVVGNLTHYALIKFYADQFPEALYNLPPNPNQVSDSRVGG